MLSTVGSRSDLTRLVLWSTPNRISALGSCRDSTRFEDTTPDEEPKKCGCLATMGPHTPIPSSALRETQSGHSPGSLRKWMYLAVCLVSFLSLVLSSRALVLLPEDDLFQPIASEGSNSTLRPIDREFFTVRLISWKREKQLRFSVEHHLSCPGVAEVQVVWSRLQGEPPEWLLESGAKVEVRDVNNLNERFRLVEEPPTRGIFHVDDDVIRPCLALDEGFFRWTTSPDRMVGFEPRVHRKKSGRLDYRESGAGKPYSIVLTKAAFLHRDYMVSYFEDMPDAIRDFVATNMNCEDIAMSLWVTSSTNQAPRVAAEWAIRTVQELPADGAISGNGGHRGMRDDCLNRFAEILGIDNLPVAQWNDTVLEGVAKVSRHKEIQRLEERWQQEGQTVMYEELDQMKLPIIIALFEQGFITRRARLPSGRKVYANVTNDPL